MATFADTITTLREERNKKRQEVADDLGISRASLEYYEKGKRKPDIEILAKLADYYDVSADYLLGRTTAKTTDKDLQFVCNYLGLTDEAVEMLKHTIHGDLVDDYGIIRGADNRQCINWLFDKQYLFALCNYMRDIAENSTLLLSSYTKDKLHELFNDDIEKHRNAMNEKKELEKNIKLSLYEASRETEDILKHYAKWEREHNGNDQ